MTPCTDFRRLRRLLGRYPVISPRVTYLVDGEGVWTLQEYEDGVLIHADMPPGQRGARARESACAAFRWAMEHGAAVVYAAIPKVRRHACFMAVLAGMAFTHENDGVRWYRYG